MTVEQFLPQGYDVKASSGSVTWQSPSNIALVKYWGKYGEQMPKNPSVSFTLNNCHTVTTLNYEPVENPFAKTTFEIFLDGNPAPEFREKIEGFFTRIEQYLPFIKNYKFSIETSNSFPHSSGIASSASGMSALALCLMTIEKGLQPDMADDFFKKKASFLARLGSGSASRSIGGPLIVWGTHAEIEGSSQLYGTPYPFEIHEVFKEYQDTILLVDKGEKQVSSTVGHGLMKNHAYAEARFTQANDNLEALKGIFKTGDLDAFIELVESEALTLHAMMMTSQPYFILMKPNTLEIINKIWEYRAQSGSKVSFTLDAGANVHVLYPKSEKENVLAFIAGELSQYCKDQEFIEDFAGKGAVQL
ncbi:diphosphomevalonate decarboxylase [Dokdonia sinensis]|uniref:Diphosphomevalonate decarboxylase n=1 Tax=Dokdonia sinensis TaxID=2479847 RepID=A0A3M0GMP0_9FLAO|nr:diphosphomevalonate decarboxylase [Dokdonia sinensis]RMB58556.1 diphosphomevalonate decarboxylase [Dokdonia sinensis]